MSTNTLATRNNLYDVLKFKSPNSLAALSAANTLVERNDMMADLQSFPANGGTFQSGLRTTSIPGGSITNVGEFWASDKATREKYLEVLCTIRSSWESPVDVLKTEGSEISQALVAEEKKDHVEGIGQGWMNLILKGPATPQANAIVGLMGRPPWNSPDEEFCYDVGGNNSDLRSVWMMQPGITTVHLLHNPNHPTLGVEVEEMGKSREVDPDTATSTTAMKHRWIITIEFMIQQGLMIRNQLAVKRLANIPTAAADYAGPDVVTAAIKAALRHNKMAARPWFAYCDSRVYTQLVLSANDKLKVYTSDKNIYQTALPMIGTNIIIRRMDALNLDDGSGETRIT
jgi:hypothetical protein